MAETSASKSIRSGRGRALNSTPHGVAAPATHRATHKIQIDAERRTTPSEANPQPIRLNVGCGNSPTEGWENLDNSFSVRFAKRPGLLALLVRAHLTSTESIEVARMARENGVRWALCGRLPYGDSSVDVVYSSHMFEHLDRSEARDFLRESLRVLVPGGTIRIAVPDLALLVSEYMITGDADRFIERTFLAMPKPKSPKEKIISLVVGSRHHHWMYDGSSLCADLKSSGFVDARAHKAGSTNIDRCEPLDLFERESESVYVEARKPANL
jgi:predicted SAM-dependent methyltransferase